MKILHILNQFLPQHIAGTEMYACYLGKELTKLGHQVVYVIPNYGSAQTDEYDYDGFRVIQYAEPSKVDRALQMGKRKPDGLRNFIEVLKAEKPDIVHFHELAGSNGITLHHVMAAKELGFKTVMTFHLARYTATSPTLNVPADIFNNKTGATNFFLSKGFNKNAVRLIYPVALLLAKLNWDVSGLGKWGTALSVSKLIEQKKSDFLKLVNHCDRMVTIARWYHQLLIENGVPENKLVFIEQGIHFGKTTMPPLSHSADVLRIIFVGRISHFKGVKMLIEVASGISSDEIMIDLYGDSGEDELYKKQCYELVEKSSNIHFKGRLNPEETIERMQDYDLLILPSTIQEMSPLVIREAFAAGVPVLASDSMGAKEQIQNGDNGWLFRLNDKDDLKEKMKELITHPAKIKEAKKHLPPVRTFEQIAKEYDGLYRDILESKGR